MNATSSFRSTLLCNISNVTHAFQGIHTPPPADLVRCHQVHGKRVLYFNKQEAFISEHADGIITEQARPVGIITADCLPILIADITGKRVAAVHGGWRGLEMGIIPETVTALRVAGSYPSDLIVAIGPAIRSCCYEVGGEVTNALQMSWGHLWAENAAMSPMAQYAASSFPTTHNAARSRNNGMWLDLSALAILQLLSCGVSRQHIDVVGECTYCGPNFFASYRRNKHEGKTNQSQLSWIAIRP